MLVLRKAEARGHTDLGWLDSRHTFSFGGYSDPDHMGFRSLRVLNDDRVAAGRGFGAHGHRDMEILTYVISGALAHKDSMGEEHTLGPNEVQAMSAGSGVIHSEFNGSDEAETHFLQIWIIPDRMGLKPSYQQFAYDEREKRGVLRLMAAPVGHDATGAAAIHVDASMYASVLAPGQRIDVPLAPRRHSWVHCVQGDIEVNGVPLKTGDGVAVSDETSLVLTGAGTGGGELLLFDLA
jgi:redox-sensitive bicupin YhaK (pirin superfamily)